jgi:hypothetical protein
MPLETGTFISDLVPTNPTPGDAKSQGDDHIRFVKSAVKATFPNVSGAVNATHTELNYVVGLTAQAAAKDGSNLTTPAPGDSTTKIATTAFVMNAALTSSLPGQAGNGGKFLYTDGTNAVWRQAYPTLSGSTAGKVLTNDGVGTSWVQAIPPISSGVVGQYLSNDGANTVWATPSAYLPLSGGTMTGQLLLKEGTAAAPGLSFANDGAPDTGFYHIADGVFGISNNTNQTWRFAADGTTTYSFLNVDTSSKGANYTTAYFQNTNGLNITLQGNGPNGYKTLRLQGGTLSFVNSAYTAQIWSLTDGGDMAITGNFSANAVSAGTVTQTSDERKKKSWQRMPHDFIARLAGLRKSGIFRWKKGGAVGVGVGAQSLEAIFPEAVHTDEQGNKSVNYGAAAMVACVELAREIEALKKLVQK